VSVSSDTTDKSVVSDDTDTERNDGRSLQGVTISIWEKTYAKDITRPK
jgi:hypothetical protein